MPTWVRCRDPDTGHEYDLADTDLRVRQALVQVLDNYPPNTGATARPRPAKYRVDKTGRPPEERSASRPQMSEGTRQHGW